MCLILIKSKINMEQNRTQNPKVRKTTPYTVLSMVLHAARDRFADKQVWAHIAQEKKY